MGAMIDGMIDRLGSSDPSLPLAVAAVIQEADERGVAGFTDFSVRYRQDYLELMRVEKESDQPGGMLSMDEVRRHLLESVLPRLAGLGLISTPPAGFSMGRAVAVNVAIWMDVTGQRTAARKRLLTVAIERLKETEATGASAAHGSRLVAIGITKSYRKRTV
ncbi:MAG: hypothetical protein ACE5FJ_03310, partial [Gemmatimonadales bacterium]